MAPRLLIQSGDAKGAIDRAFDSLQDREANKRVSDLEDMIRVAHTKMVATRKKLDELQRQSASSTATLALSLREEMARTVITMTSVRGVAVCCAVLGLRWVGSVDVARLPTASGVEVFPVFSCVWFLTLQRSSYLLLPPGCATLSILHRSATMPPTHSLACSPLHLPSRLARHGETPRPGLWR